MREPIRSASFPSLYSPNHLRGSLLDFQLIHVFLESGTTVLLMWPHKSWIQRSNFPSPPGYAAGRIALCTFNLLHCHAVDSSSTCCQPGTAAPIMQSCCLGSPQAGLLCAAVFEFHEASVSPLHQLVLVPPNGMPVLCCTHVSCWNPLTTTNSFTFCLYDFSLLSREVGPTHQALVWTVVSVS